VLCVSLNHRATVYAADDYDCRGLWMRVAVDSMRFRRTIEQTELILAPVLNENIYVLVTGKLVSIVVNGFLIIDSYKVPSSSSVDIIACVSVFFAVETLVCHVFRLTYFIRDTGLNDVVVHGVLCK